MAIWRATRSLASRNRLTHEGDGTGLPRVKLYSLKPFSLLLGASLAAFSGATVSYTVTPDVKARTFLVRLELSEAKARETFRIPAWSPGYYNLLNYAGKISSVKATAPDGTLLQVKREGKAWTVANPAGTPVQVTYRVLANDQGLGFFWAHLNEKNGFINGPSLFMYADGRKEEDARLTLSTPDGWDVATALTEGEDGVYTAGGYDELLDSPIQIGAFERRKFEVEGIPFEAVWVTKGEGFQPDLDAETERLRRGSVPAMKMFGGAPFKRYLYIVHLGVGDFAGGLEHRASTVIAMPNVPILHLDDLATHEFFHSWNVKAIRPSVLGPFDYTVPVRTKDLWFSEGVTDYYGRLHAYASGLKSRQWLYEGLGNAMQEIASSNEGKRLTVEEASQQAWEYGGFGVRDFSYYTKGLLAGLLFDVRLRARSEGKVSLDDVMRALYERGALPKPGFAEGEIQKTLVELGGAELAPLYEATIRGKGQVPLDLVTADFKALGLRVLRPGQQFGSPRFQTGADNVVTAVADRADTVQVGDKILSLAMTTADSAEVKLSRGGAEMTLTVPLLVTRAGDHRVEEDPFATEAAKRLREAWLTRLAGVGDEER